ncbi:exocyst complex component EXO70E2-like [Helianthus annuus]|uniref:exocyst complex component EXO70E2-like n=1 Tax=Helianthus annuus TaxID=4232 RepID=UPI001652CE91|nr:exocyst complex component EXO70E2-like [Helianthus annuus]
MYDVVADVLLDFEMLFSDDSGELYCNEVKVVSSGLGEATIGTFVEFENAVKGENSRRALRGGEIHPVTRYVMNYIKLLVDYNETLNTLLTNSQDHDLNSELPDDIDSGDTLSSISCQLLSLITSLEANLEEKSRLYDDNALRVQSLWRVSDAQLREELRILISEKMLPAYRSFFGRFGSQLDKWYWCEWSENE